ncbi:MAG TPA: hypothetical protein ENI42_06115 [Thermoplasmatales archaeon]|nr:hypothetical protein [Thermoplasmatales archaeon]
MKKNAILFLILLLLPLIGCLQQQETEQHLFNCILVEGKGKFYSIQQAVDHATNGDLIIVYPGNYEETILVNKTLHIQGEGEPVISCSNNTGSIITVTANNCRITGLHIKGNKQWGGNGSLTGLKISSAGNKIENNTIENTYYGVEMSRGADNNLIIFNHIFNNTDGVEAILACNNVFSHNNISWNHHSGVYLGYQSRYNTITQNIFINNGRGVHLKGASSNKVVQNTFINNTIETSECCGAEGKNLIQDNIYR